MRTAPAAAALIILCASGARAGDAMIGVFEHGISQTNDVEIKALRAAFRHTDRGWKAMSNDEIAGLPAGVKWALALDGRQVGVVRTAAPEELSAYADRGLLPVDDAKVDVERKLPRRSPLLQLDFQTSYRPLVATSDGEFADPDRWKRHALPPDVLKRTISTLRKSLPDVETCDRKGRTLPRRRYKDSEVRTIASYANARGERVVALIVSPAADSGCDYGDEEVADPLVHTFAIPATGDPIFLGTQLTLLDAGDYDGDGRSEVLFWHQVGDNDEGYVLFADDFRTRAEFAWSYH